MKYLFGLSLIGLCSFAISNTNSGLDFPYDQYWKKVEKFLADRQPQSALEVVEEIYKQAQIDNSEPHILRGIITQNIIASEIEEIEFADIILRMEEEVVLTDNPQVKACLQSTIASMYLTYLQRNYYRLSDRVTLGTLPGDSKLWSIPDIEARADSMMLESLDITNVKDRDLSDYDFFTDSKLVDISLHPYLLKQGIYYFQNDLSYMSNVIDESIIRSNVAFLSLNDYLSAEISDKLHTTRRKDNVLILYQSILRYFKSNQKVSARLDLQRLQYAKQKFLIHEEAKSDDNAYLLALKESYEGSNNSDQKALYGYYLAQEYYNLSHQYQPSFDKAYQFYGVMAHNIVMSLKPDDKTIQYSIDQLKDQIVNATLTVSVDAVVIPQVAFPVKVDFRNVSRIYFKLIKLTEEQFIQDQLYHNIDKNLKAIEKLTPIREWDIPIDLSKDYLSHRTEYVLEGLDSGQYVLFSGENSQFKSKTGNTSSYSTFQVSHQQLRIWTTEDGNVIQLINRDIGTPIREAEITRYGLKQHNVLGPPFSTHTTDREGKIIDQHTSDRGTQIIISRDGDDNLIHQHYSNRWYNHHRNTGTIHTFMDRSIYRPGQRAKGKLLILQKGSDGQPSIIKNTAVEAIFKDANHQTIVTQTIRINEYGSGEFSVDIPSDGLKGRYSIQFNHNQARSSAVIQVEEYRRPTIEGEMDKMTTSRKLGNELAVTGTVNAMSGFPLQDGIVKYTVSEQPYIVWRRCGWSTRWYPPHNSTPKVIDTGVTTTDNGGKFTIDFQSDTLNMKDYQVGKTYMIDVQVTDLGGESIRLSKTVHLTKDSYRIKHTIPQILHPDIDYAGVEINGMNFDHQSVDVSHEIIIRKYQTADRYHRSRKYVIDHQLYSQQEFENFATHFLPPNQVELFDDSFEIVKTNLLSLKIIVDDLPSGEYQFEIIADNDGELVTQLHQCLVTQKDKVSPSKLLYTNLSMQKTEVGKHFTPVLLTHTDVNQIYYQKVRNRQIIEEGWLSREKFLKNQFTITQADQGGFSIHLFAMLHGDIGRMKIDVDVPYEDTFVDVSIEIDSLLLPATDYTLQMMATVDGDHLADGIVTTVMYDASLDELYPHRWSGTFYPTYYSQLSLQELGIGQGQMRYADRFNRNYRSGTQHQLQLIPRADWYGIVSGLGNWKVMNRAGSPRMYKSKSMDMSSNSMEMSADAEMAPPSSSRMMDDQVDGFQEAGMANGRQAFESPIPRSDFGETVFFIADGKIGNLGKYTLDFKTNDALTKWKILTFVHDKEMRYGFAETVLRTQKDIQIIQNPSRTLYEGDQIDWPVTVQNSSDSLAVGTVSMTIRSYLTQDDLTDQFINSEQELAMTIEAGESRVNTFRLDVPSSLKDQIEIITTFKSEVGSDAESRRVPILSTEQFITAGHPIWVSPNETVQLLINPSTDATMHALKIELTSNPFWLVARSFPMLQDRNVNVSTIVSENLYIESIAHQIVSVYPEVERAFTSKAIQDEPTGLNRNQDLKAQDLNSTPWVRQAQRASTRAIDFAKYFNVTESEERLTKYKAKIKAFQNSDGGYPWIKGGRSSLYTTQKVLLDQAKLFDLNVSNQVIDNRQTAQSALDYIKSEINKLIKNWNPSEKVVHPLILQDLYLYALLGDHYPVPSYHSKWMKQLEKNWTALSISQQAIAGIIFLRNDEIQSAQKVKASLEERAITRADGTIFWRGINEYYAYHNAYGTQALVIDFLAEAKASEDLIEKSTQWLLANKRSNEWYNDRSTADVVHMLYKVYGTEMYDSPAIDVQLNGTTLDLESSLTYQSLELDHSRYVGSLDFELKNEAKYPIFGGVYQQYFQPFDQVERHTAGSNLSIDKTILVKQMVGNSPIYTPILESEVSVGDELTIRLTIEAFDRMQYVYVSDDRPANTEPVDRLSRHNYRNGLYLYQSPSDTGQEFFISVMPKGTHTLEYTVTVTQSGSLSSGLAQVQSFYVPEFVAFDTDVRLEATPLRHQPEEH